MLKITIAGRPNTGKSTLFNALTGTRDALVHDRPGVTRDTIGGVVKNRPWEIFDTAGLESARGELEKNSTDMALDAISSSDAVLFVVDGRVGLTSADTEWARLVRRKTRAPVLLLVNKSESGRRMADTHEFYKLNRRRHRKFPRCQRIRKKIKNCHLGATKCWQIDTGKSCTGANATNCYGCPGYYTRHSKNTNKFLWARYYINGYSRSAAQGGRTR